jgi:hypothetical protein
MLLPQIQSRFDKLDTLVKGKSFAATDASLRGVGAIKRFPEANLDRFVLRGSQDGDLIAYPGMTTTRVAYAGESFLGYESVFKMGYPASMTILGQPVSASLTSSLGAQLETPAPVDIPASSEVVIDGYTLFCEGTYPVGSRAWTIRSPLNVLRGDQWIINGNQNGVPVSYSTTVQDAFKTQNADQWNVQVIDPIPFVLDRNSSILVQSSAAVQWDNIPLSKGPCWLSLPIATHIQNSNASSVAYVRLKSADRVVVEYFTFDPILTISLVSIPSQTWVTSRVDSGTADFQAGAVRLVPSGRFMSSRLTFEAPLEGDLIQQFKMSIKADFPGRVVFRTDSIEKVFDIQPGIQTLVVPVQGTLTFIEIQNTVEILLGDISPATVASTVDVTLHAFSADGLASHVFQKPSLIGLILEPSLTWAREGLCLSDAGFRTFPGQRLWNYSEAVKTTSNVVGSV